MSKLKFRRKNLAIFYTVFLIVLSVAPFADFLLCVHHDAGQITFHRVVGFFSDSSSLNDLLVSILIGAANTLLCLLIGYPVAYLLANPKYNKSKMMLLLYVMPMWINFVLRTGATKDLLYWIGISGNNHPYAATLIGIYNYLPFVILPLYATMQKWTKAKWKLPAIWEPTRYKPL